MEYSRQMLAVSALVLAFAPGLRPYHDSCASRLSGMPRMDAKAPYRSDGKFDYFRVQREVTVTLPKPLGARLEECAPAGVRVEELQEGGSAQETGLLKKGDKLLSVCGEDVKLSSFDSVMELLVGAPEEVELKVVRTNIMRKPRAVVAAPTLTIDGVAGEAAKGVILRNAVLDGGVELYKGMMAKMSNCGGAGQCSTCWVNVVEGAENLSPPTDVELRKLKKKPETCARTVRTAVPGWLAAGCCLLLLAAACCRLLQAALPIFTELTRELAFCSRP